MHLTLTDHLTCPRCGPSAGLILMMEQATERRVVSGSLGCPTCGTRYPIERRVADLRVPGAGARLEDNSRAGARADARVRETVGGLALRVAALLGVAAGSSGFVLIDGPLALSVAPELRALLPEYEALVPIPHAEMAAAAKLELSALLDSGVLPVAPRAMRAVAWLGGVPTGARLAELVRVCRPTGRVVVDTGGDADETRLEEVARSLAGLGAEMRARDATGLVAVVL